MSFVLNQLESRCLCLSRGLDSHMSCFKVLKRGRTGGGGGTQGPFNKFNVVKKVNSPQWMGRGSEAHVFFFSWFGDFDFIVC